MYHWISASVRYSAVVLHACTAITLLGFLSDQRRFCKQVRSHTTALYLDPGSIPSRLSQPDYTQSQWPAGAWPIEMHHDTVPLTDWAKQVNYSSAYYLADVQHDIWRSAEEKSSLLQKGVLQVPVSNVQRCLAQNKHWQHSRAATAVRQLYDDGATVVAQSPEVLERYRNAIHQCVGTSLHAAYETQEWDDTRVVLGSEINVLYLMVLFEYISACFALYYLSMRLTHRGWWQLGLQICAVCCEVLLILLICVLTSPVFGSTAVWNVPLNNVLLGLYTLLMAISVQLTYTVQSLMQRSPVSMGDPGVVGNTEVGKPNVEGKPNANGKPNAEGNPRQKPTRTNTPEHAHSSTMHAMIRVSKSFATHLHVYQNKTNTLSGLSGPNDTDGYQRIDEERQHVFTHTRVSPTSMRYLEYGITAPLLLMGVQSTAGGGGTPVWVLQLSYVCITACNIVAVPLHECVRQYAKAVQADVKSKLRLQTKGTAAPPPIFSGIYLDGILVDRSTNDQSIPDRRVGKRRPAQVRWADEGRADDIQFRRADRINPAVIMAQYRAAVYRYLASSWLFFAAAWPHYITCMLQFAPYYPTGIRVMVFVLPIAFAVFGILGSWTYIRILGHSYKEKVHAFYENRDNVNTFYETAGDADTADDDDAVDCPVSAQYFRSLDSCYDVCSVTIKLLVAFIVTLSGQLGPGGAGCLSK